MNADCVQVLSTISDREAADRIAARLVEARVAACVQVVGPIRSTYRWRGGVETEDEWLLVAKTTADRYPELERAIREVHPYDLPEITALPIVAGSADYLTWVRDEVEPAG